MPPTSGTPPNSGTSPTSHVPPTSDVSPTSHVPPTSDVPPSSDVSPEHGAHHIRVSARRDTDALYDICLRTGLHGEDASGVHRDPRLLGEVYVGPYLAYAPDLAFVLVDEDDAPLGYVLGVADTAAFDDWCEDRWWPELRARYPLGVLPARSADERVVRLIHTAERTPPSVVRDYPAHLHVDLLPEAQGGGHGRRLLTTLFDALRTRGVPGVHLGVSARNTRAAAFYARLGFQTLDADQHGARLGLRLPPP